MAIEKDATRESRDGMDDKEAIQEEAQMRQRMLASALQVSQGLSNLPDPTQRGPQSLTWTVLETFGRSQVYPNLEGRFRRLVNTGSGQQKVLEYEINISAEGAFTISYHPRGEGGLRKESGAIPGKDRFIFDAYRGLAGQFPPPGTPGFQNRLMIASQWIASLEASLEIPDDVKKPETAKDPTVNPDGTYGDGSIPDMTVVPMLKGKSETTNTVAGGIPTESPEPETILSQEDLDILITGTLDFIRAEDTTSGKEEWSDKVFLFPKPSLEYVLKLEPIKKGEGYSGIEVKVWGKGGDGKIALLMTGVSSFEKHGKDGAPFKEMLKKYLNED